MTTTPPRFIPPTPEGKGEKPKHGVLEALSAAAKEQGTKVSTSSDAQVGLVSPLALTYFTFD